MSKTYELLSVAEIASQIAKNTKDLAGGYNSTTSRFMELAHLSVKASETALRCVIAAEKLITTIRIDGSIKGESN